MGEDPPLHHATACGEGLLVEPGGEEGHSESNLERVNNDTLLALLEDIAEQGFVDCR